MAEETLAFQAEVSRLLDLMVNAVYSDKEVFLRELISNASDACDKLRYEAITRPELTDGDGDLKVRVTLDKEARTLGIADNGIGMNRDDLVNDLGTIARSGTARFLEQAKQAKDQGGVDLIGQFGVGFYAVFMVADRVEVSTRKAGEEGGWLWTSDGKGAFSVTEADDVARGTAITLHLREGEDEWLDESRLRGVIKTYSDHIALPIQLGDDETAVNEASALWMRPKSEVEEEQYKEFYRHVGRGFDDPWLTLHFRAEGTIEYAALLFVPTMRPFDLFDPARAHGVKLYVKRVFITDNCEGLIPPWLRFLRGVIDSEDIDLNISREMLQSSPVLARIRQAVTGRVVRELTRKAEKDPEAFAGFWETFGAVIKEGIYEDSERRDDLLKLARFHSTVEEAQTSLAAYLERMPEGQEAIYYLTGESRDALLQSPLLEGYRAKGVEVLLMTDAVDDFWLSSVDAFEEKPFRSVSRGAADLDAIADKDGDEPDEEETSPVRDSELATLIAAVKQHLGEAVKDVRESARLRESPVCLVVDEGDMDMHLQRMLKAHNQLNAASTPILELNPRHDLIRGLVAQVKTQGGADAVEDAAHLLLDQARILEGEQVSDPAAFARRLSAVITRSL